MNQILKTRTDELFAQAEFMRKQAEDAAEAIKLFAELEAQHRDELEPLEQEFNSLKDELDKTRATHIEQQKNFIEQHPALKGMSANGGGRVMRRSDGLTVKNIILTGLENGDAPKDIVEQIHVNFPDSKATVKDVYWYRGQLKKAAA